MTRKEQYLARREKFQRKMLQWMTSTAGSRWRRDLVTAGMVKTPKVKYVLQHKGKQKSLTITPTTNHAEAPHLRNTPPVVTMTGGGPANPPHIKVNPAHVVGGVNTIKAFKDRSHWGGQHRRRVKLGRKEHKASAAERKMYGAAFYHWFRGVWPDWDPLSRHPTQADVDNGAPADEVGDWGA